jgi:ribosomal protein L37AE/L43A
MMLCPHCNDVDTRVSWIQPTHFDIWWCAECEAQWKATINGEFIEFIQSGR